VSVIFKLSHPFVGMRGGGSSSSAGIFQRCLSIQNGFFDHLGNLTYYHLT